MIPLLILGLLKQHPESNGYQLLTRMQDQHYQYIVNFTKGSFYYNLQTMDDKGLIERVDHPDSNSNYYRVSEQGEWAFKELMLEYGSKSDYVNLSFYAAMLFKEESQKEDFKQLLMTQIKTSETKIELLTSATQEDHDIPFKRMLENALAHHKVNLEWFKDLLKEMNLPV